MQNSARQAYNLFAPLQPIEPLPNWALSNRLATSNKRAMEIGGLLSGNARHAANAEAQLRHHMQQNMTLDNQYALGHNGAINGSINHYAMGQPVNYSQMNHVQHPQIVSNTNLNHTGTNGANPAMEASSPKARPEAVAKTFACSTCSKAFARKSDLARHGKLSYTLD